MEQNEGAACFEPAFTFKDNEKIQVSAKSRKWEQTMVIHLKKHKKRQNSAPAKDENEEKFYCSVCGREIDEEEYESYDGMCWECWDDQLTEESDDMFGDLM